MINISYEFTSLARLDLLEIWNYLAEEATPTLADKLLAEIEDAIETLVKIPRLGHRRTDLTRRNLRFLTVHSYFIIYIPTSRPLRIIRVVHASRDIAALVE
jgi:plasmid stabilization system protein ParE